MALEPLPPKYLEAGEEYLAALNSLGLHPELLGWGTDIITKEWHLVMLTSIIEVGGPLALNKLLFRAYNMGATPQEISPFIIRIFGDKTVFAPELRQLDAFQRGDKILTVTDPKGRREVQKVTAESMGKDLGGVHIESKHLYIVKIRKRGYEQKTREWMRFKQNVEKLAA